MNEVLTETMCIVKSDSDDNFSGSSDSDISEENLCTTPTENLCTRTNPGS